MSPFLQLTIKYILLFGLLIWSPIQSENLRFKRQIGSNDEYFTDNNNGNNDTVNGNNTSQDDVYVDENGSGNDASEDYPSLPISNNNTDTTSNYDDEDEPITYNNVTDVVSPVNDTQTVSVVDDTNQNDVVGQNSTVDDSNSNKKWDYGVEAILCRDSNPYCDYYYLRGMCDLFPSQCVKSCSSKCYKLYPPPTEPTGCKDLKDFCDDIDKSQCNGDYYQTFCRKTCPRRECRVAEEDA